MDEIEVKPQCGASMTHLSTIINDLAAPQPAIVATLPQGEPFLQLLIRRFVLESPFSGFRVSRVEGVECKSEWTTTSMLFPKPFKTEPSSPQPSSPRALRLQWDISAAAPQITLHPDIPDVVSSNWYDAVGLLLLMHQEFVHALLSHDWLSVKSRARAAVTFSLEPKRSCANCVWLLNRLRTSLLERIPFYHTAKQWRTLQKLALTSVDPSNAKFSFPSSVASLRQQQKALALTSPRRAKARVGVNSCKASKACSEQHALLQGCSKASLAYLCSSCAHQGKPKHATTCQCYKTCRKT